MDYAEVNVQLLCPNCKTPVQHDYTQNDLETKTALNFTCQNCNHEFEKQTSEIIKQVKEKVIKELKKANKNLF